MPGPSIPDDFESLSTPERILYVQELWDRIATDEDLVPVTEAQRAELDRRLAEHDADPDSAIPWEEVKRRAAGNR